MVAGVIKNALTGGTKRELSSAEKIGAGVGAGMCTLP